ncbi:hypothetical protein [Bacillus hominis]|uniref:hypothetical protein n=1 Tax=Bacillus hominis TaxID=2817478 RepID=UPI001BB3EA43|nr:hypothetical protein [Bacillus hominis]
MENSFLNIVFPILLYMISMQFLGKMVEKYISKKSMFVEYIYGSSFFICFIVTLPILLLTTSTSGVHSILLAGVLVGGLGTLFYGILFVLRKINSRMYEKISKWLKAD